MRSGPVELQPAREFVQRMHELEAELQRARQAQRRQRSDPDSASRWGLESRPVAQQEEGWFLTYLDMMTLLLVVMIVMLAFSGGMVSRDRSPVPAGGAALSAAASTAPAAPADDAAQAAPAQPETGEIPLPDLPQPYPPSSSGDFERSAYPDRAVAAMASAYPTPADLTPPAPPPEPAPAPVSGPAAVPATPAQPAAPGASPAPQAAPSPAAQQAGTAMAPASPAQPSPGAGEAPAPAQATPSPTAPVPAAAPGATSGTPAAQAPEPAPAPAAPASAAPEAPNAQSEGESLAAALPLDELGSEVEVVVNKRSVSLRVNSEILFGTGQADLSPHGLTVLKRLAEVLSQGGYDIVVEGHTDSVPVRNKGRYPSNWELSTARAGSVVRYLQASGIDKTHLRAVGYADTRPLASNKAAEGRARNRRVELVIEKRPG